MSFRVFIADHIMESWLHGSIEWDEMRHLIERMIP